MHKHNIIDFNILFKMIFTSFMNSLVEYHLFNFDNININLNNKDIKKLLYYNIANHLLKILKDPYDKKVIIVKPEIVPDCQDFSLYCDMTLLIKNVKTVLRLFQKGWPEKIVILSTNDPSDLDSKDFKMFIDKKILNFSSLSFTKIKKFSKKYKLKKIINTLQNF